MTSLTRTSRRTSVGVACFESNPRLKAHARAMASTTEAGGRFPVATDGLSAERTSSAARSRLIARSLALRLRKKIGVTAASKAPLRTPVVIPISQPLSYHGLEVLLVASDARNVWINIWHLHPRRLLRARPYLILAFYALPLVIGSISPPPVSPQARSDSHSTTRSCELGRSEGLPP